jgi:hypothetical protein
MPHHRGLAMRDDGMAVVRAGTGEPKIVFACGTFSTNCAGGVGLFSELREPIVEDVNSYAHIEHVFALLLLEVAKPAIGSRAPVEALAKQCLILVLRQHCSGSMFVRRSLRVSGTGGSLERQRMFSSIRRGRTRSQASRYWLG